MTRIFLTGASGYVGGDVLYTLQEAHPEYEITVLVRDSQKAEKILQTHPNVNIISCDLDNTTVVEEAAREADIVVHAASSNHIKSVEAIARGLQDRSRIKPGFWIQISGATLLSFPEIESSSYGEFSEKTYNDVDNANEIKDLIRRYSSRRVVDNFLLDLSSSRPGPKTAAIYPPIIYGSGRGPVKQRSVQIPELSRATIQNETGFQVGQGLSVWSNVHITGISRIFLRLVEKAVSGEDGPFWNENGLYFAENGALTFRDIAHLVTQEAYKLGLVDSAISVKQISHHEADSLSPHAGILWGTNAQEKAQRARKYLGWDPTESPSLEDEIPKTVYAEASTLGMV